MSFFLDEQKLTSHFAAAWAASPYSQIPVDYSGTSTDTDDRGRQVRFRVKKLPVKSPSIGGRHTRNFGSVLIQILTPAGDGPGDSLTIGDFVVGLWLSGGRPVRIGSLRCRAASLSGPDEDTKSGLLMTVIDVPYQSDYSA